ncbi:DUF2812 domain-containing protein [Lactiplantibacillus garii]|uniref:DUF2812 domain-containing protein n=1 Tax=Lactiplantibacillus garii TaxID=2306423 RepID=A0A426D8E2_9LACO|nr:DUF2812 domain-containing protein [Lactiplantibacillus garii]RRK10889.1 DUF2812 domain-containing protein [Lactiplantibacillus garii]
MRRYKLAIKGSEEELKWLNQLAQRGWLLTRVHGNWYQFSRTEQTYRLFSEYVTDDVVPDAHQPSGPFEILATCHLKNPDVRVLYTGTPQAQLGDARIDAGDATLQLKIALALRGHLLNIMNGLIILGVLTIVGLLYFNLVPEDAYDWIVFGWLVISFTPAVIAGKVHQRANALRVRTNDYEGAWMPTQHVFLKNMPSELDTDKVKSIGEWALVGHDKKGTYWYDVRSLASLAEIKQTLRPVVGNSVEISIVSYLGLAPIGYI